MSETRRFPMIAMGFAVVALITSLAAVIVVANRGAPARAETAAAPSVEERHVAATDVVKLQNAVETVIGGVRVKDPEVARALGLTADDVLTSISGRPLTREFDIYEALFNTGMMRANTLYIELTRNKQPALVRWRVDGDLRAARYANDSFGRYPVPPAPDPYGSTTSDPALDAIEKLDDTHFSLPRTTADKILADPFTFMKGARVVPAIKNGQPDGYKLYAIRPGSLFDKLGFKNGDTIRGVNGYELSSPDKVLELASKLKDVRELTFDVMRRGRSEIISITIK